MAMNIPAPVQILRYEIPEGTLVDQFQAKIAEYAKNGTFILASGTVYYDSVSADNAIDVYTLFIGTGAAENPVIAVPLALFDNGIAMDMQDQEQGGIRFSPFVHDIYPINRSTFTTESPFSERGLLVKSILTNIDYVTEYGIYSPTEDSTLPDGLLDSINNNHDNLFRMLVLSYKTKSYFQILVALDREIETSTKDVIPNIYIRYAHSSRVTSDGDRPNWFPWHKIGGSSLTAGDGISITDGAVAVDDTVVRTDGEQAINGSLRVWHYATAAVTVSKKSTDGNVYAKLVPNNLYFRFGDNARNFVSITTGGTTSSMGNSTYGRLTAYNDATTSLAMLSVHATDEGMYATAPSTRSTPVNDEIITHDFLSTRYLPISGGTLTGGLFGTSVALSGDSIDVSQGSCFTKTITAATTFVFTGVPSNATARFSLVLTNGGSQTVTWPSSVKWSGGANPELAASGVDVFTFFTADGGTTWYGVHSVQGAA